MVCLGPPCPLSPASVPGSPGTPSPAPGLAPPRPRGGSEPHRTARAPTPARTPAPWSSLRALADFVVPWPRPPRPRALPCSVEYCRHQRTEPFAWITSLSTPNSILSPMRTGSFRVLLTGFSQAHRSGPGVQACCKQSADVPLDSLVTFVQLFTKTMFPVTS